MRRKKVDVDIVYVNWMMCNQYEMELCRLTQHASAGFKTGISRFHPSRRDGREERKKIKEDGGWAHMVISPKFDAFPWSGSSLNTEAATQSNVAQRHFCLQWIFPREQPKFSAYKISIRSTSSRARRMERNVWRALRHCMHKIVLTTSRLEKKKLDVEKLNLWKLALMARGDRDAWVWGKVAEPVISSPLS